MTHQMKLNPKPFEQISSGKKTIELRLWDEKRRNLSVGDKIVFSNTKTGDELTVRVKSLHCFASFKELYSALPLEQCGYTPVETEHASYTDMNAYYSPEEQSEYGVVGIEIELI